MGAIFKRDFTSYFNSAIGYITMAVFFFFSGLYFYTTCLYTKTSDMYYVFNLCFGYNVCYTAFHNEAFQ